MITHEQLENWFTYHAPMPADLPAYKRIREAGLFLARVITEQTPAGPDQDAAILKVREAVMLANQARACGKPLEELPHSIQPVPGS